MRWSLLALVATFVLLTGSDGCIEVGVVDNGFMMTDEGVVLSPGLLPMTVGIDSTIEDPSAVRESIDLWNRKLETEVFVEVEDVADVLISENYIAAVMNTEDSIYNISSYNDSPLDLTETEHAPDGMVISCNVIINVDYAYDREYSRLGSSHGFGHCLAFADDPGINETVELRSIMANPIDPLGDVTIHDQQLFWDAVSNR